MFPRFNSKPDRRRRKRQLFNTSVLVFTSKGCMEGFGINVSDVGMYVFAIANLAVGTEIDVEFVPPHGTYPIRFAAVVRHRALYLYGIEFHNPKVLQTGHRFTFTANTAADSAAEEPVAVSPSHNQD
jgi:hypothetical protein